MASFSVLSAIWISQNIGKVQGIVEKYVDDNLNAEEPWVGSVSKLPINKVHSKAKVTYNFIFHG